MVFLILLAAAGITFALQHKATILHNKLALLDRMLKCTYCTGFHGGWIAYLIAFAPQVNPQDALLYAFSSAIFSYALDEVVKFFEDFDYGDGSD